MQNAIYMYVVIYIMYTELFYIWYIVVKQCYEWYYSSIVFYPSAIISKISYPFAATPVKVRVDYINYCTSLLTSQNLLD